MFASLLFLPFLFSFFFLAAYALLVYLHYIALIKKKKVENKL